ncbi:hypothetical protein BGZ72_005999 [Mortierella alpina]|nr:hypothetical protein BGZ72_005999 [Mortierella alpina]
MTTGPLPVTSQPLATQSPIPQVPADSPRPTQKPRLLTEYEFETMWDPDLRTLRLGVLLPFNAPETEPASSLVRHGLTAIRLAVDDVNKQKIIPGINMSIIVRDSQEPSLYSKTGGSAAIAGAGRLISAKVAGVIGDIRSELTRYEALMTSSVRIPHCSYASDAVLSVVKGMGWRRIYLIRDPQYLGWIDYFYRTAKEMGIYIVAQESLSTPGATPDPTFQSVKNTLLNSHARVQVVLAPPTTQYSLLREMKDAGYFRPEYAWVTINNIGPQLEQEPDARAYNGLIMIDTGWELKGYRPFEEFHSRWQKLDPREYPGGGLTQLNNNEGMAYSCVMMLANAYGELVKRTLADPRDHVPENSFIKEVVAGDHTDSIRMSETYQNKTHEGPAGPISLDKNGDREDGFYVAQSMHYGKTVQFGFYIQGNFTFTDKPFRSPPSDAPRWTLQNPRWNSNAGIACGVLSMIVIIMILISAALVLLFRNHIVIKASSPTFCLLELLGILLVIVWCLLHVGVPSSATCITNSFILTLGVTLLTGSLTIKSYRIYRIFNSVNFAHQTFQTRILLRYMGLLVLLCMITPIVEMATDPPQPTTLNVGTIQWFFPYDIYLATYYITLIGTYVIATLALLILFVPKFRSIRKSRQKSWGHGDRRNQDHSEQNVSSSVRARVAAMTRIPANITAGAGRLRQTVIDRDIALRSNRIEQNPLYAWMGSQMPHRGSLMTLADTQQQQQQLPASGRLIPRSSEDAADGRESSFNPWKRRFCSQNAAMLGTGEGVDAPGECEESGFQDQLSNSELALEPAVSGSDTGIQGKCTNGHSTSYLMHSMTQEKDELVHPTLRVVTCHTGALLIQFSSQAHLRGWMGLFSEQDLNALGAQSFLTEPADLHRSSISGTVLDVASRRRSSTADLNMTDGSASGAMCSPDQSRIPFTNTTESTTVNNSRPSVHPLATTYSNPAQIDKDETDTSESSSHPNSGAQVIVGTTAIPEVSNNEDDEDSDDLYDPEFGIGVGIGRRKRRQQSRSMSHSLGGTAATPSGTSSTIPSAAVISAAAAAVAEGWSESDALAAAMADPSLKR